MKVDADKVIGKFIDILSNWLGIDADIVIGSLNVHSRFILECRCCPKFVTEFIDSKLDELDIEPGIVLLGIIIMMLSILVIMNAYDLLHSVLTCLYPMLKSIRILEKSLRKNINYKYATKEFNRNLIEKSKIG